MITGLIEAIGRVDAVETTAGGVRMWFDAPRIVDDARAGDSIAVNGCCLTAAELEGSRFAADVVPETLARTTLGALAPNDPVNLERSLRLSDRLGGHLVQGHVDGVGEVVALVDEGDGRRMTLGVPAELGRFVAEKGSLAVDGVSLTVAARTDTTCDIAYIPHTLAHTVAGRYAAGRRVNLEVDLVARYVARLLNRGVDASTVE